MLPIAHERLAQAYSLGEGAITYTDDLTSALRQSLDMNDAELAQRRARVAAVKQRFLEDSLASLANALAAAGLRQG